MMEFAVVGAGLSGATIASQLGAQYRVDVFEERGHVAGNAFTKDMDGIQWHVYGPHIFHTANNRVENYVKKFATFSPLQLRMKSKWRGKVYSGPPINLHTINQFFDSDMTPDVARDRFRSYSAANANPRNFEEAAVAAVGEELYLAFIYAYTKKQWGIAPCKLPASIFARLPVSFEYDDGKYPAYEFQGIPECGYTKMVERMLAGTSNMRFNTKFKRTDTLNYDHVFYSGPLDEYFDYQFGELRYRTLDFDIQVHQETNYQGCPVMAYHGTEPYTRITEHKHFLPSQSVLPHTIITKEIPRDWKRGDIPYYPMRLDEDKERLRKYQELAKGETRVTFLGRLGTYRYIDMDQCIAEALRVADQFRI